MNVDFKETDYFVSQADLNPEARSLFGDFIEDSTSSKLAILTANYYDKNKTNRRDFKTALASRIFEEFGVELVNRMFPRHLVLSTVDNYLLFRALHPESLPMSDYGMNFGISGHSYPDSVVFRQAANTWQIVHLVECKMGKYNHENDRQLMRFLNKRIFGEFQVHGQSMFNTTKDKALGEILYQVRPDLDYMPVNCSRKNKSSTLLVAFDDFETTEHPRIKRVCPPFSRPEFSMYVDFFLKDSLGSGQMIQSSSDQEPSILVGASLN